MASSRADKMWSNARREFNGKASPTLLKFANLMFTKSGPNATAETNSMPRRIVNARRQFGNAYSRIINRFANEFAGMDGDQRKEWDRNFRRYVIGLEPLPAGELGQAVLDFRKMMKELLDYQQTAGMDIGDSGEGYFPRIYSPAKIAENLKGFIDAAKEMYRKRDLRLLNKSIDEINQRVDAEAARKKQLDIDANKSGANRRIKPDAEYQQVARDRADEMIAALQAEHDAKDEAHYDKLANDWAFRSQHGRLDEVRLEQGEVNESRSPDHSDPRMFTAEEAAGADAFMDDDIDKTIHRYIYSAVKKSEIARVFGANGKTFSDMLVQLQKEDVDTDTIRETADLVRGSLQVGQKRLEGMRAKFMDWANFVVVSGYLGLSFINNLFLEPISYGIRTGSPTASVKALAHTWKNFYRELHNSVGTMKYLRANYGSKFEMEKAMDTVLAETLGLVSVDLERIAQDSHWDFNADAEESGSPLARWLTQRVLKANLMEQSERAKISASMAIARGHLLNVARSFNGTSAFQKMFNGVKLEASSRSMMREAGVPNEMHASFAAFVETLKDMDDDAYFAAVSGGSPEAIFYRQALQRTSTGLAIQTDASMKISDSDNIWGRMWMQLMNYSYAYANLVKDHMYDSALGVFKRSTPEEQISAMDRAKYAMPLAMGVVTTVASVMTKVFIASMFPSDSGDDWLEKEPEEQVLDAASYAGMFGKKFEYIMKATSRGQFPMGPVPEAMGRAISAVYKSATKAGDSDQANYQAVKSIKRAGMDPIIVGGASAVPVIGPALGLGASQAMRNRTFSDDIIEGLSGGEKPKK
jgi:hypothetical protein